MRILVIGAAPTGLGVAYRLNELKQMNDLATNFQIVLLEKESYAGGLSCTIKDEHGFLWDMGGHITFNHNFPYYENAVRSVVDKWNELERNCQVDMNYIFNEDGIHLVPYPAQFAVPLFPKKYKEQSLKELNERYETKDNHFVANNFDEWVNYHFGPTIRDQFFKIYTRKVWTVESKEMSSNWVGTRVAKLPKETLEELCSMNDDEIKKADFGWGPNSRFTFPKFGGTGAVWSSMAKKLPAKWIKFNCNVESIDTNEKVVTFVEKNGDNEERKEINYDFLINTIPINKFLKKTGLPLQVNLKYNKVYIIGVGLRRPMTKFLEKFTWLYFPDPKVPFFRVTMFSRYGEVTPDSSKYWSLLCECARPIDDPISESEMRELTISGLIKKSLIHLDQIVDIFSILLPYGYPIPTVERDEELRLVHNVLESQNIFSRGRFGGWKYEVSNQDHCFMQGKEIVDRIILNQNERVYKTGISNV